MPTPSRSSNPEHLGSAADTVIDRMTVSQQQAIETMETAGAAFVEGMTRVQREVADFVTERLRLDMEAQQELLRCKSFDEARTVQAKFLQTAMDQYSAETARLLRLGGEIFSRSTERT